MTLRSGVTPDGMPHQLRFQGFNALIVIPGRAPVCLRSKRTGHIRRNCNTAKCSECFRYGHTKEECVKTFAGATAAPAAREVSPHTMDAEEAESAVSGLELKAPAVSDGQRRVPGAKGGNETAAVITVAGGAQPSRAVASTENLKAPTVGRSPPSEEAEFKDPIVMDETGESIKRGLDDPDQCFHPSPGGATPKPNQGKERNKKGRFLPLQPTPSDVRTRHDSK